MMGITGLEGTPWWVLPGAITAVIGLVMLAYRGVVSIYSAGQNSEVKRRGLVTQEQLERKMRQCRADQVASNSEILHKVNALVSERREIWEIVRSTDKRTEVMETNIEWIMKSISGNGRAN